MINTTTLINQQLKLKQIKPINITKVSLYKNSSTTYSPVVTKYKFIYKHSSEQIHQWEYKNGKLVLSIWNMPDNSSLNQIRQNKKDPKAFFVSSVYKEPSAFEENISDQITLGKIYLTNRSITLAFKWLKRIEKLYKQSNKGSYKDRVTQDDVDVEEEVSYRRDIKSNLTPDVYFDNEREIPFISNITLSENESRNRKQRLIVKAIERAVDSCPVVVEKMERRIRKLER
jgi:hypothetical protein